MKDYWEATKRKKMSKKKKLLLIILLLLIISTIVITILYIKNENVQNWINKNILKKEIKQEDVVSIEVDENAQSCAYSQYLGVLSNNNFDIYNSSGNKEETLNLEISNPIFNARDRFLAVAQKGGQKVYLITNKTIQWEKKVEGDISQIKVNKNGYVAIVISNTSYKTVIEMYNPEGERMFKTFLSSTRVSDISISNDNKYLALAEVDTSGTIIQSAVKIKSIEDPNAPIEEIYKAEGNKLITNVSYQEKNRLLCRYTDSITMINEKNEEVISKNEDKKITFSSIYLSNSSITLEEKSSGLFTADSILKIINSESKEEKEYVVDEVTKELYAHENTIALNLGTEIEFVSTGGWLLKRYIANQEITNVVLSNGLAGVVYRNKIEIIKL